MEIKLTFLGAAQCVTGSKYLVEVNGARFLVDCGLYQEREFRTRDWEPFYVPPESLDAVLLTHAHLDHCGYIPRLVQQGFKGPIYCTDATVDIAEVMLLDSAKLQEEDAAYKARRHKREKRKGPHPELPLYTTEDAQASFPLFNGVNYDETFAVAEGVEATFRDAGHVLGSAMIKLSIKTDGETRAILFSGDAGKWDKPIIEDPTLFSEADYVLIESTYGDRLHESIDEAIEKFIDAINGTVRSGGTVVIPSFALERSQEILYYLNRFFMEGKIPHLLVFVDSPMAVKLTDIFNRHPEMFDEEMQALLEEGNSPFDFRGLKLVRTIGESKAINNVKGTIIIIAGSGMCTGGRIKHHLVTNISRLESTVLFIGYQARGTLGREIVNGAKEVRILGEKYPVRANIVQLNGFSAHADRDQLYKWLSSLKKSPRCLFITHGEPEASMDFSDFVREKLGWRTVVPEYKQTVVLD
jgi:metallo-beta-lactamase family protein